MTAMYAVLEVEDKKRAPEFSEEETAMRMVAENAPSTTFVGEPPGPWPWTSMTRKGWP